MTTTNLEDMPRACGSNFADKGFVKTARIECAIVGGGPGGLVAALYLSRCKRKVAVFSAGTPRVSWAPRIRNLLAQTKGISGKKLLLQIQTQVRQMQVPLIHARVTVKKAKNGFQILSSRETLVKCKKVILAVGMRDVQPNISNLNVLRNARLLAYCPICDVFEHGNQRLALIANKKGVSKLDFISRFNNNICLVIPSKVRLSAKSRRLIARTGTRVRRGQIRKMEALKDPMRLKIDFFAGQSLEVELAYVALGSKVPKDAFGELNIKRNREGYLLVNSHQETSVPGVYAVGDCVHGLSQISVAAGQAAIAAIDVHNKLRKHKLNKQEFVTPLSQMQQSTDNFDITKTRNRLKKLRRLGRLKA